MLLPISAEAYASCFAITPAPLSDYALQRPKLTPALTLRVAEYQSVHQLSGSRIRLLLEPAQNLAPHTLERVRTNPV